MAARGLTLGGVPVLMYHGLATSIPADVDARERRYWLSPASFRHQLAQIHKLGLPIGRLADLGSAGVVITFDDGRASDYEVAFPLLLAAGARAEFFVNTAMIGQPGYLTWDRMAEMARAGMAFQSHAHDHVLLPGLPPRQLEHQLSTSKRLLEDRLGHAVDFVAAPYGALDRGVVKVAHDVGYRGVCTSLRWPARPGTAVVNRVAVYRDTTEPQFAALLARRPWAYLPGIARIALLYLPKRVLRRVRPRALGARLRTEEA